MFHNHSVLSAAVKSTVNSSELSANYAPSSAKLAWHIRFYLSKYRVSANASFNRVFAASYSSLFTSNCLLARYSKSHSVPPHHGANEAATVSYRRWRLGDHRSRERSVEPPTSLGEILPALVNKGGFELTFYRGRNHEYPTRNQTMWFQTRRRTKSNWKCRRRNYGIRSNWIMNLRKTESLRLSLAPISCVMDI